MATVYQTYFIEGGKVMKKSCFLTFLVISLFFTLPAASVYAESYVFGKIPYTMAHGYHQGHVKHLIAHGKELGHEIKVIDGEGSSEVTLNAVETFISQGVKGILVHCNDPKVMDQIIKMCAKAGILVTSFYGESACRCVPHLQINEAVTSEQMGAAAAKKWKEWYPDKPIKVGIIDFMQFEVVQVHRTRPFIAGVKSVDPSAEVVSILEGNGNIEQAMAQMQDMLQAHPDVNIVYGNNADHALGALAALEAAGRGKAIDGKCQTEIVVGTDATEAELLKVFDPGSSLKITQGLQPAVNGKAELDLMLKIVNGEIKADAWYLQDTYDKYISYWDTSLKEAQEFLEYQYFSKIDLEKELQKRAK